MKAEFYLDEDQREILKTLYDEMFLTYEKEYKRGAIFAQIFSLNNRQKIRADCYLLNQKQALHIIHALKEIGAYE